MTTEEQFQSSDIHQTNGTVDDDTHEHDDQPTSNTSSEPPVRRSRFFRSRRKQRLNEDHSSEVDGHADEPNESNNSPENSGKSINLRPLRCIIVAASVEQPAVETSVEEPSIPDTPFDSVVKKRSLSPPPPPPSDDDEPDTSSTSEPIEFSLATENPETQRLAYLARNSIQEKAIITESRPSLPTIYSGYQRKKSQSVKLTRLEPIDAYPKKNVRFADDFGLDLSQIKVIKSDELPHVPSAAFKDLHISDDQPTNAYQERMKTITYLEQRFENPIHTHGFDDRVSRHKVVLEQANAIDNRIYGTIKIVSFGLNKRVKIRLTTDNWITSQDYDTTYITDSFDGTHDRFSFTLDIPRDRICLGNNIQLCVSYESFTGSEYWDNNYQQNYRFESISRTIPDYSG